MTGNWQFDDITRGEPELIRICKLDNKIDCDVTWHPGHLTLIITDYKIDLKEQLKPN